MIDCPCQPDTAIRAPTILIADDHDLVRDGVKLMVAAMWPASRRAIWRSRRWPWWT